MQYLINVYFKSHDLKKTLHPSSPSFAQTHMCICIENRGTQAVECINTSFMHQLWIKNQVVFHLC